MKFINFTIIKFSVFLTLGILSAFYFPKPTTNLFPVLAVALIVLLVTWRMAKKKLIQHVYFGATAYLCFFLIGFINCQLRQPQGQHNHYYNSTATQNIAQIAPPIVQLKITEVLKPDNYHNKFLGKVIAINQQKKRGKVLVNITKDPCFKALKIDESLVIYGHITPIAKPLNPHQFDYNYYMKSLGVFGQIRAKPKEILARDQQTKTLFGFGAKLRTWLILRLKQSGLKNEERSIVQALILGQRREITQETNAQYAAAGAIHLLAVSGLHVGIIFMLFKFILAPLNKFKAGKYIQPILLVLILFSFALLAGFSPSVVRAATMFSLFIIADQLKRRTNSINTLFLSYFGLLIINPLWLFQVGFQLSYLAVFFILWVQPKMYNYVNPKNYVLKLFWGIITVSVAAQIGVMPLSLYYFHQFPGLFLLTNVVVLPLLSIILIGGILLIILASLEYIPAWYLQTYAEIIRKLNQFIAWIAQQDRFLIENISFSKWTLIGSFLLLISLILFWKKATYRGLVYALGSCSVLVTTLVVEKYNTAENKLILFHKNNTTLLAYKRGNSLQVLTHDTITSFREVYPIKGYCTAIGATAYVEEVIPNVFRFRNKNILIVDSLGLYPKSNSIDMVILTNSPKVNLNRLIDSICPSILIADGSNYYSYVARWEQTCSKKKLPFHHTGVKGAFIFK